MKEDINKYSQMIISNEIVATGSWLIYSFIDYMNGKFSDELYLFRQEETMEIGKKDNKHYYLEQNPLTKELKIIVDDWSDGKRRTYTNKEMMRKIFSMLVV